MPTRPCLESSSVCWRSAALRLRGFRRLRVWDLRLRVQGLGLRTLGLRVLRFRGLGLKDSGRCPKSPSTQAAYTRREEAHTRTRLDPTCTPCLNFKVWATSAEGRVDRSDSCNIRKG